MGRAREQEKKYRDAEINRLLYVAATRARDSLIVGQWAKTNSKGRSHNEAWGAFERGWCGPTSCRAGRCRGASPSAAGLDSRCPRGRSGRTRHVTRGRSALVAGRERDRRASGRAPSCNTGARSRCRQGEGANIDAAASVTSGTHRPITSIPGLPGAPSFMVFSSTRCAARVHGRTSRGSRAGSRWRPRSCVGRSRTPWPSSKPCRRRSSGRGV